MLALCNLVMPSLGKVYLSVEVKEGLTMSF